MNPTHWLIQTYERWLKSSSWHHFKDCSKSQQVCQSLVESNSSSFLHLLPLSFHLKFGPFLRTSQCQESSLYEDLNWFLTKFSRTRSSEEWNLVATVPFLSLSTLQMWRVFAPSKLQNLDERNTGWNQLWVLRKQLFLFWRNQGSFRWLLGKAQEFYLVQIHRIASYLRAFRNERWKSQWNVNQVMDLVLEAAFLISEVLILK